MSRRTCKPKGSRSEIEAIIEVSKQVNRTQNNSYTDRVILVHITISGPPFLWQQQPVYQQGATSLPGKDGGGRGPSFAMLRAPPSYFTFNWIAFLGTRRRNLVTVSPTSPGVLSLRYPDVCSAPASSAPPTLVWSLQHRKPEVQNLENALIHSISRLSAHLVK